VLQYRKRVITRERYSSLKDEFLHPISERLTDVSGQILLGTPNEPALPDWTENFIVKPEESYLKCRM